MIIRFLISAALLLPALGGDLRAGDWIMHRGEPALIGRAACKAPTKPSLLWSFKASKPVKAAAVIVKGSVYFGDDGGNV